MTVKRASRSHESPTDRTASHTTILTEQAVAKVLEAGSAAPSPGAAVDPSLRRELVAATAYFIAERRGFVAGHELEDWVAAETAVDRQLRANQAA